MKRWIATLFVLLLATAPATAAPAVRIEGVAFSPEVKLRDARLAIRGHGLLRYMVVIKAYAGALYLDEGVAAADVLDPVAKRLELSYFHAIKKEDFATATRQKIADNVTDREVIRLKTRIDQLAALYRDVQPGDRYALTFIPGRGTELALNGEPLGVVPGDDFAGAVFAIWLGANPIDRGFRDRLLGVS